MASTNRLASAQDKIRKERTAFLNSIENFSQPELDFKPSQNSWSIGEIAHHVGLTEKVLRNYMEQLLQSGDREKGATRNIPFDELPMGPRIIPTSLLRSPLVLLPFSIMSSLMPPGLQSALLANPVVNIKTAPAVEPRAGMDKAEIIRFLEQVRSSTLELLEPRKDWDLSRFRWFHPLMGTHDVYGTLELLASHDRRHFAQIERVRKNPKFPKL